MLDTSGAGRVSKKEFIRVLGEVRGAVDGGVTWGEGEGVARCAVSMQSPTLFDMFANSVLPGLSKLFAHRKVARAGGDEHALQMMQLALLRKVVAEPPPPAGSRMPDSCT